MEPTQKRPADLYRKEEDIDLGFLIYKTGRAITDFFKWIGKGFSNAGQATLHILFFLRRNIVWLLLGTVLGLSYGVYLHSKTGSKYYADMTVRANFNSTRSLYGTLDFFNALISSNNINKLSSIFKITPAEASSLKYFEAIPVRSEMIMAEMYKNQFLKIDRNNNKIRMDTFWTKTIQYKDFKSSLTKFDYPLHEITLISTNASIFPKIQQGLINQISGSDLLQQIKDSEIQTAQAEEHLLTSSLQNLDTLRNAYNKRLSQGGDSKDEGGNKVMTLLGSSPEFHTPELDLYDKMLQLKDELRLIKNQAVVENKIIQVYSPFSAVGQKVNFLRQSMATYSVTGFCIALAIVAFLFFYKLLSALEKKKKAFA